MRQEHTFYTLFVLTLGVLLLTNPLMRYPYDMWEHLFIIDSYYQDVVNMPQSRMLWHTIWRNIFLALGIDSTQIFLRAQIIHSVQLLLSFGLIYYFSRVVISLVLPDVKKVTLNYLAYWSAIVWLIIFATFSMFLHHLWIFWYSVNYQITLPFFWYLLGLVLLLLFQQTSLARRIFYLLQIVIIALFIFWVHPMELVYFAMHLGLLGLIYINKVWNFVKRHIFWTLFGLLAISSGFYMFYNEQSPQIVEYLHYEKLPELLELVKSNGKFLHESQANRALASFNELMLLSIWAGFGILFFVGWRYVAKRDCNINLRIVLYLFISSLFVLIPVCEWSAGIASVITKMSVVNRFYYSSPIFVILPITLYLILKTYRKDVINGELSVLLIALIVATALYSKYFTTNQSFYKNIQSLKNGFDTQKIGFHLTTEKISEIGEQLNQYEKQRDSQREVLYLARGDVAMVLRYIYHANVYWRGRMVNPSHQDMVDYQHIHQDETREIIIFETPHGLPNYEPFK